MLGSGVLSHGLAVPPAGYRHIHLLSKDGTSIPPSSLFVHIRIAEPPGPEQD